jgi:hypothetical protein
VRTKSCQGDIGQGTEDNKRTKSTVKALMGHDVLVASRGVVTRRYKPRIEILRCKFERQAGLNLVFAWLAWAEFTCTAQANSAFHPSAVDIHRLKVDAGTCKSVEGQISLCDLVRKVNNEAFVAIGPQSSHDYRSTPQTSLKRRKEEMR